MSFCPKCGRERGADELFCPKCGNRFSDEATAPAKPTEKPVNVASELDALAQAFTQAAADAQRKREEEAERKRLAKEKEEREAREKAEREERARRDAARQETLRQEALQRQREAQQHYDLALSYGNEKKYADAFGWYQKAAEKGHIKAQYKIGLYYVRGFSVAKDETKGMSYIQKAAELGDVDAKAYLRKQKVRTDFEKTRLLGTYGGERIKWNILKRSGNKMLVVADKCLEYMPYNQGWKSVTWETCTLRKWLNNEFYQSAFTAEERALICKTTTANEDNPKKGTPGGKATEDYVALLSYNELCSVYNYKPGFFGSGVPRSGQGYYSAYAYNKMVRLTAPEYQEYINKDGKCWYWLRSPGNKPTKAIYVGEGLLGVCDASVGGMDVHEKSGVKPIMWLSL